MASSGPSIGRRRGDGSCAVPMRLRIERDAWARVETRLHEWMDSHSKRPAMTSYEVRVVWQTLLDKIYAALDGEQVDFDEAEVHMLRLFVRRSSQWGRRVNAELDRVGATAPPVPRGHLKLTESSMRGLNTVLADAVEKGSTPDLASALGKTQAWSDSRVWPVFTAAEADACLALPRTSNSAWIALEPELGRVAANAS